MATQPLPSVALEKVSVSTLAGYPRDWCSLTIQASNVVKSSDVATPLSALPSINTQKSLITLVTALRAYTIQNTWHMSFLPNLSDKAPAVVPKMRLEMYPMMNSHAI